LDSRGQTTENGPTEEFATIDQVTIDQLLPKRPNKKPEEHAEDIESVLDWMRTNGVRLSDEKLPKGPERLSQYFPPKTRSPQDREKDLESALTWVRNKNNPENPELEPFKTIDQFLPPYPGQSPEDRAKDIENAYTWLRENGKDIVEDFSPSGSPKDADISPRGGKGKDVPSDMEYDWARIPGHSECRGSRRYALHKA
jgi:hypothetical protein